MGYYRHIVLSFLVVFLCFNSFCETTLTDIANLLWYIRQSVGDKPGDAIWPNETINWNVNHIAIDTRLIQSDVGAMYSYFHDWDQYLADITSTTYDTSLDVEDIANDLSQFVYDYRVRYHPSISNELVKTRKDVVSVIEKSIDTNQYYLAAILAKLKDLHTSFTDTNYLFNSSLWAIGALARNINLDPLSRYNYALSDLQDHSDDPDYLYKMYGIWQYGPMQILFDYDWYTLDGAGRLPTIWDSDSEADVYYKFSQQFLGFPTTAKQRSWLVGHTSPMAKLKMKYYGTYPTYLAISNLLYVTTNDLPSSFLSSSYFVEDDQGDVYVNSNSSFFAFSERVNSNALDGVATSYDGPSNSVWDVGEDTEVGERFSSLFSVTNLLSSLSETFGELTDNLNESPNSMKESLRILKGGSRVFTIDYHPNFWIQGMTEPPTQTITVDADKVLTPDVLAIIEFVKTFALFGGSLILGVTTFYSVMKENPLWFN